MKLGLLRSIAVFAIMSLALVTVGSNSVSAAPIAGRNIGIACVYNGNGYCPSSPFNSAPVWTYNVGNSSGVSTFPITAPTISGAGDYYIDVDDYSSPSYYITADVYTSRLVIHFGAADATPGGPISSTVIHGGYLYTMASNHGSLPSDGSSVATFTVTVTTAPTAVNHLAISGVTAPVTGATPVTSVTADSQYTGTVSWSTSPVKFAPAATYTATITLSATADNTFSGVAANSFTVAGATSVTNSSGSGVITAVFPATAGCAPGDYINTGICVHAPIGSFSSGGSATTATLCPTGFTTLAVGQTVCVSKPSAPTNVSATISNGTALISFTPGTSGGLATHNEISMYLNGQLFGGLCNLTGASACPIGNLGPDAKFSFIVTAVNDAGSAASAMSNTVTYSAPTLLTASTTTTTTTTTTTQPPVKSTITCVKGSSVKKVTAVRPVCPAGYKKR